jgi:hypothetical protein
MVQNRNTDTQVNVRLTSAQRETLEKATAKLVAGVPGAKVPLGPWLLQLGLAEAKRILGGK